ncbi:MAG: sigma-54-dependent Fis family transcriptional regulator [Nitrospirae bacterium]|nr:sigma-54-dependent Fis family transcriptional regulator [Nitrospirota bacterium]MBI3593928.1 sigma-54-dependent Fis family transcriptional regulator [Nitrospirota bacterium]
MQKQTSILIVDDEINIRAAIARIVEKQGFQADTAENGQTALSQIENNFFHLVITDLKLPDMNGLDVLKKIKERSPETEVVVMTAYGTIETAVNAIKGGAYDYLTKPVEKERLILLIDKALERQYLSQENHRLRESLKIKNRFEEMIGKSDSLKKIYETIDQVVESDAAVLITGESGTGKELVARAIHQRSGRKDQPFITLNCGALPETLFESELFGYEKGAFTGAVSSKMGRFELADGGVLFLDEIGELNFKNQVDFLRVLETMEFRRLGGTKLVHVNVRFIAATNRNLIEAVGNKIFREDLYYRINVVPIHLPPLRERKEDIPILVEYFLREFASIYHREDKTASPETMRLLIDYSWPGNIRQLKNVIEREVILVRDKILLPEHLPAEIQNSPIVEVKPFHLPVGKSLEEIEKEVIAQTLRDVTHHREKAAKILGISTRALQYKIKSYGIKE